MVIPTTNIISKEESDHLQDPNRNLLNLYEDLSLLRSTYDVDATTEPFLEDIFSALYNNDQMDLLSLDLPYSAEVYKIIFIHFYPGGWRSLQPMLYAYLHCRWDIPLNVLDTRSLGVLGSLNTLITRKELVEDDFYSVKYYLLDTFIENSSPYYIFTPLEQYIITRDDLNLYNIYKDLQALLEKVTTFVEYGGGIIASASDIIQYLYSKAASVKMCLQFRARVFPR